MAGRAERARVARAFTAGVLGPGHPCRDDAALLVSEPFGNGSRHSGSGAAGQTVTVTIRAAGGVVRVEVTDRGGSEVPQPRPFDGEAEDRRGWGWWRDWPPGGLAAERRADGGLVRATARLNLPARQPDRALAAMPGAPGSMESTRQIYARSGPGTSTETLSGPPARHRMPAPAPAPEPGTAGPDRYRHRIFGSTWCTSYRADTVIRTCCHEQ